VIFISVRIIKEPVVLLVINWVIIWLIGPIGVLLLVIRDNDIIITLSYLILRIVIIVEKPFSIIQNSDKTFTYMFPCVILISGCFVADKGVSTIVLDWDCAMFFVILIRTRKSKFTHLIMVIVLYMTPFKMLKPSELLLHLNILVQYSSFPWFHIKYLKKWEIWQDHRKLHTGQNLGYVHALFKFNIRFVSAMNGTTNFIVIFIST